MKSKQVGRKLSIKKTTITNLQNKEMKDVKGGWTGITCKEWICNTDITCIRWCPI